MSSWVRLDTTWSENAKIHRVSHAAKVLYIAGLCFCGRNQTDSILSPQAVRLCAVEIDISSVKKPVRELVDAGLWVPQPDDAFLVPGFLQHNPTAATFKAKRENNAKRQQEWRDRQQGAEPNEDIPASRNALRNASHNALRNAANDTIRYETNINPPKPPQGGAGKSNTGNGRRRRNPAPVLDASKYTDPNGKYGHLFTNGADRDEPDPAIDAGEVPFEPVDDADTEPDPAIDAECPACVARLTDDGACPECDGARLEDALDFAATELESGPETCLSS